MKGDGRNAVKCSRRPDSIAAGNKQRGIHGRGGEVIGNVDKVRGLRELCGGQTISKICGRHDGLKRIFRWYSVILLTVDFRH